MILAKTRRLGGSLIVTLPKALVEKEGLHEDQLIEVNVRKVRKSGFGMCKGLGTFTKEDKLRSKLE